MTTPRARPEPLAAKLRTSTLGPSVRRRASVGAVALAVASCALLPSSSEGRAPSCPAGMALVASADVRAYCIDRWEASTVEVRGRQEVVHPPYEPVTNLKVKAVSRPGVIPQGYISKNEAESACKLAGKRLCASDEWQLACRGKKTLTFPYGETRRSGYCNDSGRAPLASLNPGLGEELYASAEALNDPRINMAPNTVAKTGAFSRCKSAFGVFDMVGNLHEWTSDVREGRGVFRGGYYQDTHLNGDGCSYKTVAHDVSYHDYSTGFRCCADAR